jgi:hypothetical protein
LPRLTNKARCTPSLFGEKDEPIPDFTCGPIGLGSAWNGRQPES